MTMQTQASLEAIEYPDDDGQPMADNTLQFEWIVTLKDNLEAMFRNDPTVFVAGNLLWYPVLGRPDIRAAPDALVAFGRPKGYRGSYRQWVEGDVALQVVFEVLSPGNRDEEMDRKFEFYDAYGVEEYYLYDPYKVELAGWRRERGRLHPIPTMEGWSSPRLGIRFDLSGEEMVVLRPNGSPFLTFLELETLREDARREADQSRRQTEQARQDAEQAKQDAEQARQRTERLAAQLRALGVEPEA